jgi:hypothetical protein
MRATVLSESAKFCAIAAHLIRNEQINLRSGDGFRGCQSAEEVLATIRDELGSEAASALRRFTSIPFFPIVIGRTDVTARRCNIDTDDERIRESRMALLTAKSSFASSSSRRSFASETGRSGGRHGNASDPLFPGGQTKLLGRL